MTQIQRHRRTERRAAPAPAPRRDSVQKRAPAPRRPRQKQPLLPGWQKAGFIILACLCLLIIAAQGMTRAYINDQIAQREAAWQRVVNNHPLEYKELIEEYAGQNNLEPAFVAAIIMNESSFRRYAESSVGASGLMQLMPDTAEWIAGKLDDDRYTFDRMWDGETNIRYGCWYLGYLSRLFHGDAQLVSAAYHAGQTTVTQWLSDPAKSADGVSLDITRLSDGPTKQYIGRVTQTYGIYQSLLYPDEAFDAQDAVPADGSSASAVR